VLNKNISAILAIDKNLGLGYRDTLLFRIKEDLQFFKQQTLQSDCCIIGRKTFDSLPAAGLPGRNLLILTSNEAITNSISNPLDIYLTPYNNIFIIGGNTVYLQYKEIIKTWYITYIKKSAEEVDVFFDKDLLNFIESNSQSYVLYENEEIKIIKYCL